MARPPVNPVRPEWIAGVRAVQELLEHRPLEIERILVARESTGRVGRLLRVAREAGVPVSHVDRERLASRVGRRSAAQGIAAQVAAARYAPLAQTVRHVQGKPDALIVLVDRVTDAGNLGAILRTSAAAGADAVILSREGTVGLNPHVIRASAGAVERIPVCRDGEPGRRIEALREAGFLCVALDPRGAVAWTEVPLSGKVLVVAGGEERGARPGILEKCDNRVAIPLERGVESLNVAVATGVLLFELRRQRRASLVRG